MQKINYSILVCTYNRCNYLKETIESIIEAIGKREDCELIIIDNNSTDQTSEIVESFSSFSSLKYYLETKQGLSHARNRGMREAKGEVLVYLDDDIELPKHYFEVCDQIFQDPDIAISGGKVLPHKVNIPHWLPKKYYFLVSIFDEGNEPKHIAYLMGANFAIRRSIALQIGKFNTNLGRKGSNLAGGEEIDYLNRAKQLGFKTMYNPDQKVWHKINEKLNELYVLKYAFELGKSERIVEEAYSKLKVQIKKIKSVIALIVFYIGKGFIKHPRKEMYLKIINQFAKGYLQI
jgi:glucosyl-dolichyl phosphate glucuronosyltransferase